MSIRMSFAENKTGELWRSFMPRRKEVRNTLSNELFSLQVFDPTYFERFDPAREYEKWALVEVKNFDEIPEGMTAFTLPGGLYAVFHFTGLSTDTKIFDYIFSVWLPGSIYSLDSRPHFEVLGDRYKNADPNSEEDIWIPIKPKH